MDASLILASASPRRRELLARAGYRFEVVPARVAEVSNKELSIRELTTLNATRKGLAIARQGGGGLVLAADTLVALGGEIIGKPRDLDEARAILRRLSGRTHEVCTAVFMIRPSASQLTSFAEISRVKFRTLSKSAIDAYLSKIRPLDKAGAYAAQGRGVEIIEAVEGSLTNVIGLPMERTVEALSRFGLQPRR